MATKRQKQQEPLSAAEPAIAITERAVDTMMSNMEDMTNWNKQCFDACVTFTTGCAKGCEEMGKAWMSCWQNMTQQYMQCCKDMMTARTMKDAMDTQSEFMRSQVDTVMSESTRMAELCTKLASEMGEPLQSQWSNVTSMMTKASKAA